MLKKQNTLCDCHLIINICLTHVTDMRNIYIHNERYSYDMYGQLTLVD